MAISTTRSKRKVTGGRYIAARKRRLYEMAGEPTLTKVGERRFKVVRVRGGNEKQKLLSDDIANVYDPQKKVYASAKILNVVENPANRHFIRRNIITKGAIIETKLGKARVTSRPGSQGIINAVLIR